MKGHILTSEVETELSDTDDEPSMTSEEESEDERVPNHLVSMRTLTYQATHKELLAPVTLDPTQQRFGGARKRASRIAKIEKELLGGGATMVNRYRKTTGADQFVGGFPCWWHCHHPSTYCVSGGRAHEEKHPRRL